MRLKQMLKIETPGCLARTRVFQANLRCARGAAQEDEWMLVLSRKVGERIRIAGDIVVVVTAIQGDRIKIGIEAPKSVRVLRGELREIRPAIQHPS